MDTAGLTPAKRRFAGRHDAPPGQDPFDALAEALLSPRPGVPAVPSAAGAAPAEEGTAAPSGSAGSSAHAVVAPPDGFYVLIPSGIEPHDRRRAALEVARRLAPPNRPAAVFLFDGPLVDAYVLGEIAGGGLGPQNHLTATDIERAVADLVGQCAQIGIAVLGEPNGHLRRLDQAAPRTVFVLRPDDESIVETYRGLKTWRQGGARSQAALVILGGEGAGDVGRLHRRLQKTARAFLGCHLSVQGGAPADACAAASGHPEPQCIFSQTPADQVWPCLLAAASAGLAKHRATTAEGGRATREPALPAAPDICPVFSLWNPADRAELLAAIEAQAPALLAGGLRQVFCVDVDEPGAPPLAAVRHDGALVAILVPAPGESVDTPAAEKWLAVHRTLLALAHPSAGIAAEARTSAMVLAPLESPPADGIRRFLPVRMGGHRGVVLLP
jgi:hypothetical protein